MGLNIKGRRPSNPTSYKFIKLTSHAIQRAEERLNLTRKEDIRKLASMAKNSGINFTLIRDNTYEKFGLTKDEYNFIKANFDLGNNSTNIYVYKGCVFIFVGKGGLTLKTVVKINYT